MQRFYKYQGAGNDFIIFDNRLRFFNADDHALVARLCDRHFGIGADGLMLLEERAGYDFQMVYFNADGRQGSMCGNGGRCMVAFAHRLGLFDEETRFIASDGEHTAILSPDDGMVKLKMIDSDTVQRDGEAYVLDTGSPHYVLMVADLENYPVFARGREIRYSERYAEQGINVNFVQSLSGGGYAIRTYERGVENETLACGTGATAAAMAMAIHEGLEGRIRIPMKASGGDLSIYFHKDGTHFTDVHLEGPATPVFEGVIDFDKLT